MMNLKSTCCLIFNKQVIYVNSSFSALAEHTTHLHELVWARQIYYVVSPPCGKTVLLLSVKIAKHLSHYIQYISVQITLFVFTREMWSELNISFYSLYILYNKHKLYKNVIQIITFYFY